MTPQNKERKKWFWIIAFAVVAPLVVGVGLVVLGRLADPSGGYLAEGKLIMAMNDVRQVGMAANRYANDHEGQLPEKLPQLLPDYLDDDRLFSQTRLTMPGAKLDELPPDTVIMTKTVADKKRRRERTVVVHADLSVHEKR